MRGGRGGGERKAAGGAQAEGSPLAIVLGLTILQGGVSLSLVAGVTLSNLPEGMSSSAGLKQAGWPQRRVLRMWSAVVLVSNAVGSGWPCVVGPRRPRHRGAGASLAGGALLAMLADTLLPETYNVEGMWTGSLVVASSRSPLALSAIE